MLGIAGCIFLTPKTIDMGAFRFMVDAGFTAIITFVIFTSVGVLRLIALYSNGHWSNGWIARCFGCIGGAVMWLQMMFALFLLTGVTGTLSVGIPIYCGLTAIEIRYCYLVAYQRLEQKRAGQDGNSAGARLIISG